MELLRPQTISSKNSIIVVFTVPAEIEDPVTGVTMTKSVKTISMGTIGVNPKPVKAHLISGTDPRVKNYEAMQGLMNNCINNAEDIKSSINSICMVANAAVGEEERAELMKKDFMWLKQWFMDDIRGSKLYKHFEHYDSTKKLKDFSRGFHDFITDRNKYTHGKLCFVSPEFHFAIEYIDEKTKKKTFAHINADVFKSYNNIYKQIIQFISEYHNVKQQMRKGVIK